MTLSYINAAQREHRPPSDALVVYSMALNAA